MTIKILASLAIAATLFTACGDETTSTPPSKAEQCATGLSSDCLLGTWSSNGPIVPQVIGADTVDLVAPNPDFSTSPATLKFYIDEKKANKFEFINSPLTKAICQNGTGKIYGDWQIVGNSLHLKANIGNMCLQPSEDQTIETVVQIEGAAVTLKLKHLFFMSPELDLGDEQNPDLKVAIEKYTFVSSN